MPDLSIGLGLNKNRYSGGFSGVLDDLDIANNAVFIFSPYKRLVKSYKGYAIQIRRSSDYTYQDFGFDSNGNLKVNDILDFVGSGDGLVRIVYNQANSNYNIEQLTIANEPKIIDAGIFLSDGLLFDGINDYFVVQHYSSLNVSIATKIMNFKIVSYKASEMVLLSKNWYSQYKISLLNTNNFRYTITAGAVKDLDSPTMVVGDTLKYATIYDNNINPSMNIYKDGILSSSNSDLTAVLNTSSELMYIGIKSTTDLRPSNVNLKSLVIFNNNQLNNLTNLLNI